MFITIFMVWTLDMRLYSDCCNLVLYSCGYVFSSSYFSCELLKPIKHASLS